MCLQCCHSTSVGSVLTHLVPTIHAVVSLQHSQSLQLDSSSNTTHTARGPSWKDLEPVQVQQSGEEKDKTKPGLERGRQPAAGQQAEQAVCAPSSLPEVLICNHSRLAGGGWSTRLASGHQGKETSMRREGRPEEPAKKGCFGFA